jgi:hypothetical protein
MSVVDEELLVTSDGADLRPIAPDLQLLVI